MTAETPVRAAMSDRTANTVAALSRTSVYPPSAYFGPSGTVERIETHKSWVFLTDRYAYKMKKPVRDRHVDLGTLERRHRHCRMELRLNRRLAPNVYLGVAPLTVDAEGEVQVEGGGEPVEWLIKMRRLPAERMLSRLIASQAVTAGDLRRVGAVLAHFYRAKAPVPVNPGEHLAWLKARIADHREALAEPHLALRVERVGRVHEALDRFVEAESSTIERRIHDARIVEAHGDLRPEHICIEERPAIFDCLEFDRGLRLMDPADELAFLSMECERLGAPFVGPVIVDEYERIAGDRCPHALARFYKCFRATLWAWLAATRARDSDPAAQSKWGRRAGEYLALADAARPYPGSVAQPP